MKESRSSSDGNQGLPVGGDLSRLILESTPHCIALLDAEFKLIYGNNNFFRFIKQVFGREMAVGDELLGALPSDRQLRWQLRLQEVFSGQCTRIEEALEVDGVTRYFDVSYQPLNEGDRWDKIVVYFEEITARKRREVRLIDRSKDLEEALETRQTLLSVISHDLRSPIFQLNGLLFLIQQDAETRDEARLQLHAEDLEERVAHLTHTLDNLLNWSSLQRQHLEPRISKFSLADVCEHAVGLLDPLAQRKGVTVSTTKLEGFQVTSDREMIAFIIRNLLNNAIKFSFQGGNVEIQATSSEGMTHIHVVDYGVGFEVPKPEEEYPAVKNASKPGTWGERGTGLGLKLCYEFAEQLQGAIKIVSSPGHGTEAVLILPKIRSAGS